MKILHMISGGDTGGAKTHVFSLMSVLPKQCDVKIVCFIRGQFFDDLQNIDVDSELIEQKNRFDLSVLDRLCSIVNEDKVDIIHAHGARANFIASKLKKRISIPVVTTIHSDYLLDFDGFYKKLVFTSLNVMSLKKLDYYIAVSSDFKRMLVSRGYKPSKVYTVYNGMDYSTPMEYCSKQEFAKRIGLEYDENTTYIGLIGRHDRVKGHDVFLKGAAQVLKRCKDVHFVIAGEGDGRDELVKLIEKLGIEKHVTFAGFIKDIYSFINFIDINTLTSRCESFPYVLMEGARMSKPTVSSRVGGIPDLIEDGITGCLFENENYKEFAQKILLLVQNKELQNEYGKALCERAVNNFSNVSLAQSHVDIYKAILRHRGDSDSYDAVLSGYYGFRNSGDDALLTGIVQSLTEVKPDIRLLVLSRRPKETRNNFLVDSVQRFNPFCIDRAVKKSKMLITGGGSLLQDATSDISLVYYLYVMKTAIKNNKKVYIYANGIGPLSDKNVPLAAKVVKNVNMITLRDEMSLGEIKRMGIENVPLEVTADPAILLKPISRERAMILLEKENPELKDKKLLCVSVRNWKRNDAEFCTKLAKICDEAYEKHGLTTVFLPMKPQNDTVISKTVAEKMKHGSVVLEGKYSVEEYLGIVSACECVIAMRLHSLIYALTCAVPAIGLVYDPKVEGFLQYIGNDNVYGADCIDSSSIVECISTIMENKESITNDVLEKRRILCQRAERNAIIAKQLLEEE